ncbi:MAG: carboxylesterase family protein [Selenomonadaceae bacterium]|nr:carboxylesterase family protein [Selenomonadaceae bacterium]
MSNLTRRDFIKATSMAALAFAATGLPIDNKVFAADNCTVKTRYGTFNGFVDKQGVKTWLGIPYAQPPVGNLRWQAPQPLKPSNKTFDAKKFGFTACQEIDENEGASLSPQSEDCLTLNIWKRSEKKNLPVMVFIYGGSFVGGGSTDPLYYGSNFAAANDVVIVTINYRLNIFGFMNFAAIDPTFEDCGGYLGMKDQIASLKWIKENIAEFGGNPDNVTVFGESAGSISTMMLTIIPAAKNLFQKAIPQSGNSYMYNTPEYSAQLAEMFMNLSGTRKMSDLLKKSTAELKNIYVELTKIRPSNYSSDYMVTCDGKFIPLDPFKALNEGGARGIKLMTGTNADEWHYWLLYNENFFEMFREVNHEKISPVIRHYKERTSRTPEEIYKAWLKNRPDTEENYMDFVNQVDWRVGQELAAEYQSKFEDVYFYLFSEPSSNEKLRSCHSIDLPYTFNNPDKDLELNPKLNLVRVIQSSWAAFAATGNPNNKFIPHWEKYSVGNRQTMELNSKGCVCHKDLNMQNLNALRYVYES